MSIFIKEIARRLQSKISLFINQKKFFDMSKITSQEPILQRNGVKNSLSYCKSDSYKTKLDGYALQGEI
jgi:hypothetical protein